jgi:hypothetical protein
MHQTTFASVAWEKKGKITRREGRGNIGTRQCDLTVDGVKPCTSRWIPCSQPQLAPRKAEYSLPERKR